jgi:two-component system, probable response regulator PhcQ
LLANGTGIMKHKILLVDDDPNICRALTRALHKEPYEILTARTADEARDVVCRWPVSLVVSDELMPGMLGTDFCAWIARNCPDVVRIVLTGHRPIETALRAAEIGQIFRFFTKPCDIDELIEAIRAGLQKREQQLDNEHRNGIETLAYTSI